MEAGEDALRLRKVATVVVVLVVGTKQLRFVTDEYERWKAEIACSFFLSLFSANSLKGNAQL